MRISDWSSDVCSSDLIPLRTAFAISSNVAAARLTQEVGVRNVIRAARDLGISTPIPNEATIALGTANVSVLELTSAFAAIAAGAYPVSAHGRSEEHTSELQSLMRISYAVFCLKKKKKIST